MDRAIPIEREPCPWLPLAEDPEAVGFHRTRRHGEARGAMFYRDALAYAQELWVGGRPAQALLQLNKAWLANLGPDDAVLAEWPPPYEALRWILERAADGNHGFLGDPVRHFQHLASRMSGPRAEIRRWRAWCCHHLAMRVLAGGAAARDGRQIAREGLGIPGPERSLAALGRLGWPGEVDHARRALRR